MEEIGGSFDGKSTFEALTFGISTSNLALILLGTDFILSSWEKTAVTETIKFSEWSSAERKDVLINRKDINLLMDRDTLQFQTIEQDLKAIDFTNLFELPPLIMDKVHLSQIISYCGDKPNERWIRTLVLVYWNGGKVLFRKINSQHFVAEIRFPMQKTEEPECD